MTTAVVIVKPVTELTSQQLAFEYTRLTGEKLGKITDRMAAEKKLLEQEQKPKRLQQQKKRKTQ